LELRLELGLKIMSLLLRLCVVVERPGALGSEVFKLIRNDKMSGMSFKFADDILQRLLLLREVMQRVTVP